jgi:hypothetical protein
MVTKEFLKYMFCEKTLTAFEISEIIKLPHEEVIELLKQYEIDSNPTKKKYRLINKTPLSNEQRQFIVGSLLGKGRLIQSKDTFELLIKCGKEQKDHLLWQKMILGNYVNNFLEEKDGYSFRTAKLTELKFFWKLFYDNNRKIIREDIIDLLTNFGLAVWFSDCGIVRKDNIRFSTYKYSLKEHEVLQRILKVNFGINSKICEYERNGKKSYFLSINKRNSEILMKIIKPFIDRSSETLCQISYENKIKI